MKHAKLLSLLAIALTVPIGATAGPILDRIRESGKIIIAHREASVPFSYLDADKKPIGYAMDLCAKITGAIAHNLKMKALTPEYMLVSSGNRVEVMAEAKADLECESTTNSAERRKKVRFTVPHYISGSRLAVKADSAYNELNDLHGKSVASTKGTSSFKALTLADKTRVLHMDIRESSDHIKGLEMLAKNEVSAFGMDDVLLFGLISQMPRPEEFKVVGKYLTVEPLAIMLPPNDQEFAKMVDDEMVRLIMSREIYAIYDKWFMQPIPPKNVALKLPRSYLLKDSWKYPSYRVDSNG